MNDFSIICNNCVGGIIYHRLGLKFTSPFINLWIDENEFLKMLPSIKKYFDYELKPLYFETKEDGRKYPVCQCGDITLNGTHYISFEKLNDSWNIRKKRINYYNCIYILVTHSKQNAEKFLKMPYKNKICICPYKSDNKNIITIYPDLIEKLWYKKVIDYFKSEISNEEIIKIIKNSYDTEN